MKKGLLIGGGVLALFAVFYINLAVYPFATTHPNYSDVERVFNKMQFPSEWTEVRSSENRGIAGRACPIESSSKCYHKSRTFRIPEGTPNSAFETILKRTGCPVVSIKENKPLDAEPYTTYACSIEGLTVDGGTKKDGGTTTASFYVTN